MYESCFSQNFVSRKGCSKGNCLRYFLHFLTRLHRGKKSFVSITFLYLSAYNVWERRIKRRRHKNTSARVHADTFINRCALVCVCMCIHTYTYTYTYMYTCTHICMHIHLLKYTYTNHTHTYACNSYCFPLIFHRRVLAHIWKETHTTLIKHNHTNIILY